MKENLLTRTSPNVYWLCRTSWRLGPVEAIFGKFYWPGASGSLLASSSDYEPIPIKHHLLYKFTIFSKILIFFTKFLLYWYFRSEPIVTVSWWHRRLTRACRCGMWRSRGNSRHSSEVGQRWNERISISTSRETKPILNLLQFIQGLPRWPCGLSQLPVFEYRMGHVRKLPVTLG